jgi:hypothetical protein
MGGRIISADLGAREEGARESGPAVLFLPAPRASRGPLDRDLQLAATRGAVERKKSDGSDIYMLSE